MPRSSLLLSAAFLAAALGAVPPAPRPPDGKDWPTYNADARGYRFNAAETALGKHTVGGLVEKWRFPRALSLTLVGVVHATPVVVNGHVYFGTATLPAVYKLTPDGQLKWSYTPRAAKTLKEAEAAGLPDAGFLNSPLVTGDAVFIADVGGSVYALDRKTGKERWVVNTRQKPFPGAHPSNCFFAAPVLADGKLIVAGGGFEHFVAIQPGHKCCTGRGFVAALEPETGKAVWKYEVGEEPKPLVPPVTVEDGGGKRVFHFGPSTSSVWCTPSYDAATGLIYFGTDTHNAPRRPTKDDPRLHTRHSCAVIAVDARTGAERWVTQVNPGDVWNYGLRTYDPKTGMYKDQSVGDTPKPYTIDVAGRPTRAVGAGCKNGVFYVMDAATGKVLHHTPRHAGPPSRDARPEGRTLALPGAAGGLQTGCATDGKAVFTNGMDMPLLGVSMDPNERFHPPTGGRVVSIGLDARTEHWRHERPRVKAVGGTKERPAFTDVGDPVASGVALANGVAYFTTAVSNKLVALDTADGRVLKEVALGPVWCGPSVSRGRVYVGSGNLLFSPLDGKDAFFPKQLYGRVVSFGLPGRDEVDRMGAGDE
ncbi:MAG: PQQ-binding-like beta-propeller repeat protein [Gemmataceae bacterium]